MGKMTAKLFAAEYPLQKLRSSGDAFLFLASDESSYIVSQDLAIDSGIVTLWR